jgi:uncharacterized repeat protein (TIGR01451 family)
MASYGREGFYMSGLLITTDDGTTSVVPGTNDTYTIVVSNPGPSDVTGANVSDPLPTGVSGGAWAETGSTGGGSVTGSTSGNGTMSATVNLPINASVTFSFTATIDPSATGSLTDTATATPPGGTPAAASDTDTLTPQADLQVITTDSASSVVPGIADTYAIVVTNNGPSTVSSITLTDAIPGALLNPVFGTPSAGNYDSSTGVWSGLSLANGQSVSITLTGTIAPTATGSLTNTVTVAPPAGVTDTNTGNNVASDTDTLTPQADLSITTTDNRASVVPGTPDTYTIVVSNNGPSTVSSITLTDAIPGALLNPIFGIPSAGSYDPSTGVWSGLSLASGQSVSITLTGTIAPAATGSLTNTVTVAPPAGVTDTNTGNNAASDTDTLTPQADLSITETDNRTSVVPGTLDTYTIVVSNNGPSAVTGASVSDPLPVGVTGVTWMETGNTGGGSVNGPTNGVGALATTVNLPVNASVTFSFTATIDPSATGSFANTATVSPPVGVTDPTPGNNSFTDTDNLTPEADLSITNTDGATDVTPGTSDSYTIVVTNNGPSTAVNSEVTDLFPSAITSVSWTAVASAGSSVGAASGTGPIDTGVTLLPGGTVRFTANAQISPSATGALVNTATVTPPPGLDSNTGNNTATDTDTVGPVDLSVTVTDGATIVESGTRDTYTIIVTNNGPGTLSGFNLIDAIPGALLNPIFGNPSAGSYDPSTGVWSGLSLPSGQSVFIRLSGVIAPNATGSLTNTVLVSPPAGVTDTNPANNSASDTDTLLANLTKVTWTLIDGGTPVAMAGGDFEGLGSAQLIASESGAGTWIFVPSAGTWSKIDNGVPTIMAEGDLYGTSRGNNNQTDLVAYYPGNGTYTWQSGFGWTRIDGSVAEALTTGTFGGGGVTEIAESFAGAGVWLWSAGNGWSRIDTATPALLASGNFYGTTNGNNNNSDLVAFYPGGGTWIWAASAGWSRLDSATPGTPSEFAAGNFLGTANGNNNQTDLAAYFPSLGTYIWSEATGWTKIDSGVATGLCAVDLGGNGQDQLLGYFPNGGGMWEFQFGVGWRRYDNVAALPITSQTPEFATGNFLGSSAVLPAVGFQNTPGVWLDPPTTLTDIASNIGSGAVAGADTPNAALLGQAMAAFAPPSAPATTLFNISETNQNQTASLTAPHPHAGG